MSFALLKNIILPQMINVIRIDHHIQMSLIILYIGQVVGQQRLVRGRGRGVLQL